MSHKMMIIDLGLLNIFYNSIVIFMAHLASISHVYTHSSLNGHSNKKNKTNSLVKKYKTKQD